MTGPSRGRRALALRVGLLLLAPLLGGTGCLGLGGGPPQEVRLYDMLPPAGPARSPAANAKTLEVSAFQSDPAIDRDELVWRRGDVETGAYADQRWARLPGVAARDLVVAALRAADLPVAVTSEPPALRPAYLLEGYLARCDEVDQADRWLGVVELRVVLRRQADGAVLLRRTYTAREVASRRNPLEVVAALRRGLLTIGDALARDVRAALGGRRDEAGG